MHVEDVSIVCDDFVGLRFVPGLGDDYIRVEVVFEMRIAGPQLWGETQAEPHSGEQQETDPF